MMRLNANGWGQYGRACLGGLLALLPVLADAEEIVLRPVADTSLFQESPNNNLGTASLASGSTVNLARSRALLQFDIADGVPAEAIITGAELTVTVVRTPQVGAVGSTFALRRVLVGWQEGTKGGNVGLAAALGETTWNDRSAPSLPWTVPGGTNGADFASTVSSTVAMDAMGSYVFPSRPQLIADVQNWLVNSNANFGWVLICQQEETAGTARRFGSREDPANAPVLKLNYFIPNPSFRIDATRTKGGVTLSWTGGQPPYQLQTKTNLTENWTALGSLLQTNVTELPVTGKRAFFRVLGN